MGVFGDVHEYFLNIFITGGRGEPASREGGEIVPPFLKKDFKILIFEKYGVLSQFSDALASLRPILDSPYVSGQTWIAG